LGSDVEKIDARGIRGLLLQPSGPERGIYQRIGHFEYWSYDNNEEDLETVCGSPLCQTEASEYEFHEADRDGNFSRVIKLI